MKTYVICGLSARAIAQFVLPMMGSPRLPELGDYSSHCKLAGILDADEERVQAFNRRQGFSIPYYSPDAFYRMIAETNPDVVVVTTPDGHHARYIIDALCHDRDVISEKPMVIDGLQAQAVIEAEKASRGTVRVAHNMRYMPLHKTIKRMLNEGLLGRIVQAQMIYQLDTYHGSSYFNRWNRDRATSGGLTVTKACHHFDLLNWWLDDSPEEVFAFGTRNYYGAESPFNPAKDSDGELTAVGPKGVCPYNNHWNAAGQKRPQDDHLNAYEAAFSLPNKVQYPRALSIYDKEIEIEDTYSATIRYRAGASVTYSLNASSPWEGYVLGIQGTHGRLETVHYTAPSRCPFPVDDCQTLTYYPMFGQRQIHVVPQVEGGHGGADHVLKDELFIQPNEQDKELRLSAGAREGALAVAVGEAVWRSAVERRPITIKELVGPIID